MEQQPAQQLLGKLQRVCTRLNAPALPDADTTPTGSLGDHREYVCNLHVPALPDAGCPQDNWFQGEGSTPEEAQHAAAGLALAFLHEQPKASAILAHMEHDQPATPQPIAAVRTARRAGPTPVSLWATLDRLLGAQRMQELSVDSELAVYLQDSQQSTQLTEWLPIGVLTQAKLVQQWAKEHLGPTSVEDRAALAVQLRHTLLQEHSQMDVQQLVQRHSFVLREDGLAVRLRASPVPDLPVGGSVASKAPNAPTSQPRSPAAQLQVRIGPPAQPELQLQQSPTGGKQAAGESMAAPTNAAKLTRLPLSPGEARAILRKREAGRQQEAAQHLEGVKALHTQHTQAAAAHAAAAGAMPGEGLAGEEPTDPVLARDMAAVEASKGTQEVAAGGKMGAAGAAGKPGFVSAVLVRASGSIQEVKVPTGGPLLPTMAALLHAAAASSSTTAMPDQQLELPAGSSTSLAASVPEDVYSRLVAWGRVGLKSHRMAPPTTVQPSKEAGGAATAGRKRPSAADQSAGAVPGAPLQLAQQKVSAADAVCLFSPRKRPRRLSCDAGGYAPAGHMASISDNNNSLLPAMMLPSGSSESQRDSSFAEGAPVVGVPTSQPETSSVSAAISVAPSLEVTGMPVPQPAAPGPAAGNEAAATDATAGAGGGPTPAATAAAVSQQEQEEQEQQQPPLEPPRATAAALSAAVAHDSHLQPPFIQLPSLVLDELAHTSPNKQPAEDPTTSHPASPRSVQASPERTLPHQPGEPEGSTAPAPVPAQTQAGLSKPDAAAAAAGEGEGSLLVGLMPADSTLTLKAHKGHAAMDWDPDNSEVKGPAHPAQQPQVGAPLTPAAVLPAAMKASAGRRSQDPGSLLTHPDNQHAGHVIEVPQPSMYTLLPTGDPSDLAAQPMNLHASWLVGAPVHGDALLATCRPTHDEEDVPGVRWSSFTQPDWWRCASELLPSRAYVRGRHAPMISSLPHSYRSHACWSGPLPTQLLQQYCKRTSTWQAAQAWQAAATQQPGLVAPTTGAVPCVGAPAGANGGGVAATAGAIQHHPPMADPEEAHIAAAAVAAAAASEPAAGGDAAGLQQQQLLPGDMPDIELAAPPAAYAKMAPKPTSGRRMDLEEELAGSAAGDWAAAVEEDAAETGAEAGAGNANLFEAMEAAPSVPAAEGPDVPAQGPGAQLSDDTLAAAVTATTPAAGDVGGADQGEGQHDGAVPGESGGGAAAAAPAPVLLSAPVPAAVTDNPAELVSSVVEATTGGDLAGQLQLNPELPAVVTAAVVGALQATAPTPLRPSHALEPAGPTGLDITGFQNTPAASPAQPAPAAAVAATPATASDAAGEPAAPPSAPTGTSSSVGAAVAPGAGLIPETTLVGLAEAAAAAAVVVASHYAPKGDLEAGTLAGTAAAVAANAVDDLATQATKGTIPNVLDASAAVSVASLALMPHTASGSLPPGAVDQVARASLMSLMATVTSQDLTRLAPTGQEAADGSAAVEAATLAGLALPGMLHNLSEAPPAAAADAAASASLQRAQQPGGNQNQQIVVARQLQEELKLPKFEARMVTAEAPHLVCVSATARAFDGCSMTASSGVVDDVSLGEQQASLALLHQLQAADCAMLLPPDDPLQQKEAAAACEHEVQQALQESLPAPYRYLLQQLQPAPTKLALVEGPAAEAAEQPATSGYAVKVAYRLYVPEECTGTSCANGGYVLEQQTANLVAGCGMVLPEMEKALLRMTPGQHTTLRGVLLALEGHCDPLSLHPRIPACLDLHLLSTSGTAPHRTRTPASTLLSSLTSTEAAAAAPRPPMEKGSNDNNLQLGHHTGRAVLPGGGAALIEDQAAAEAAAAASATAVTALSIPLISAAKLAACRICDLFGTETLSQLRTEAVLSSLREASAQVNVVSLLDITTTCPSADLLGGSSVGMTADAFLPQLLSTYLPSIAELGPQLQHIVSVCADEPAASGVVQAVKPHLLQTKQQASTGPVSGKGGGAGVMGAGHDLGAPADVTYGFTPAAKPAEPAASQEAATAADVTPMTGHDAVGVPASGGGLLKSVGALAAGALQHVSGTAAHAAHAVQEAAQGAAASFSVAYKAAKQQGVDSAAAREEAPSQVGSRKRSRSGDVSEGAAQPAAVDGMPVGNTDVGDMDAPTGSRKLQRQLGKRWFGDLLGLEGAAADATAKQGMDAERLADVEGRTGGGIPTTATTGPQVQQEKQRYLQQLRGEVEAEEQEGPPAKRHASGPARETVDALDTTEAPMEIIPAGPSDPPTAQHVPAVGESGAETAAAQPMDVQELEMDHEPAVTGLRSSSPDKQGLDLAVWQCSSSSSSDSSSTDGLCDVSGWPTAARMCDGVTLVDVLQQLEPDEAARCMAQLLSELQPAVLIATTPCANYNPVLLAATALQWCRANQDEAVLAPAPTGSMDLKGMAEEQQQALVHTVMRDVARLWPGTPGSYGLPLRHAANRFEWTRKEFRGWADELAQQHGYTVTFKEVGHVREEAAALQALFTIKPTNMVVDYGAATQLAVFSRTSPPTTAGGEAPAAVPSAAPVLWQCLLPPTRVTRSPTSPVPVKPAQPAVDTGPAATNMHLDASTQQQRGSAGDAAAFFQGVGGGGDDFNPPHQAHHTAGEHLASRHSHAARQQQEGPDATVQPTAAAGSFIPGPVHHGTHPGPAAAAADDAAGAAGVDTQAQREVDALYAQRMDEMPSAMQAGDDLLPAPPA